MNERHYFVLVSGSMENYEIGKQNGVWSPNKRLKILDELERGDKILFYISGEGFVATGEITETYKDYTEKHPKPPDFWKSGGTSYIFGIKIANDFKEPKKLEFGKKKFCEELKISPLEMRSGIFKIEEWQYNRVIKSVELIPPTIYSSEETPKPKETEEIPEEEKLESLHTKVQWMLIELGKALGCDVWVAGNDRGKKYKGKKFGDLTLSELPRVSFGEEWLKNIDVIWWKGNAIKGAFEVEYTTSIYSGILRLSDLLGIEQNIQFNLYIVAPSERKSKVFEELKRPTFKKLKLNEKCKYISFEELESNIENIKRFGKESDAIDKIAESVE